jgi:ubiquinone/menaquinone biosynthesis C-methylase UbiE
MGTMIRVPSCDDQPTIREVKVDYDKMAKLYARFRRFHPVVLERLLTDLSASSPVLEVGCGSGNYISTIRKMIGCECHGIEPSEAMLAEARKKDAETLWRKGSAESLLHPPGRFTFILCVDVIHHLSNVPLFIAEMFRTLSHRGRACIVMESESDIRGRLPLSLYFPDTVELELRRYPPIGYLKGLLRGAGFSAIAEELAQLAYNLESADSYERKVFSCLNLISEQAHARGISRMSEDLLRGPIECISRYTMLWATK